MNIQILDGKITLKEGFYSMTEANALFSLLRRELLWKQDEVKVYGKTYLTPRLQAWYGDEGKTYSYSGLKMTPHPWKR